VCVYTLYIGEAPGKPGGPAGTCSVASSCITLHVVRCRYCAEGKDSLTKTAVEYGLDLNWLRMWALNGITFSKVRQYQRGPCLFLTCT
jgi:hypothetical protein